MLVLTIHRYTSVRWKIELALAKAAGATVSRGKQPGDAGLLAQNAPRLAVFAMVRIRIPVAFHTYSARTSHHL
jgi:hypothetical protein